ncbi:MAG: glycine zipper 2TM domain-containing protein [Pseudomonadota bacterium]
MSIARTLLLILIGTLGLSACAGEFDRSESGTVIGAVAGGILGNQVGRGKGRAVATVAGALIGGIVGHEIGRSMDEQDRRLAQNAELRALEDGRTGRPIAWRNPDSGHYGEVIPRRAYERENRTCRDYEHVVWIDDRREVMHASL